MDGSGVAAARASKGDVLTEPAASGKSYVVSGIVPVIVDGRTVGVAGVDIDTAELTGRTENMRYVNFPGNARLIGHFVDVEITEVMANSLRGRILTQTDGGS